MDVTGAPAAAVEALDGAPVQRSAADRVMRRLLRLEEDAPACSLLEARSAFSKSIWISATRCLLTYVLIPLVGPIVGVTGAVGPILGLLLGAVSTVFIVAATRRFFAADHKWRWGYAAVAGGILVLLVVQAVIDVGDLLA